MAKKILYSRTFLKNYRKRIIRYSKISKRFDERLYLFAEDVNNPILKDHKLIGVKSDLRAFSITGDIRVIYKNISKDTVMFLDVGTHNQIY
ncbi:MAG TPA: type II toxin-antitoxin system mRNA interferase toxin, RelE/StbE family [Patescibacteria group bacterium]|nr:type II toxin-antitoxin system mRNA interferase toxin, RelE/StbE family [Patescibacteria group bacterium]